jgi:ABC-2 type transport system ATP-binding protein
MPSLIAAEGIHKRYGRQHVVEELSGGTRQKVNLAIALLHDPQLLLLDEPYSGFDLDTYRRFVAWTQEAKRDGRGIVLVTHMLLERERFDALYELREGTLHVVQA